MRNPAKFKNSNHSREIFKTMWSSVFLRQSKLITGVKNMLAWMRKRFQKEVVEEFSRIKPPRNIFLKIFDSKNDSDVNERI